MNFCLFKIGFTTSLIPDFFIDVLEIFPSQQVGMFNLLTYFNRAEMLIPTNNNKKFSWLRTGHDSFTATSCIMQDLASTMKPYTKMKLEATNYMILTTEGGERGNCVCDMSIQRNTV